MYYFQNVIFGDIWRVEILTAWRRAGERSRKTDTRAQSETEDQNVVQTETIWSSSALRRQSVQHYWKFHTAVHGSEVATFSKGYRFTRKFSAGQCP